MSRPTPDFDRSNRLAVTVILTEVGKYGGEESAMVRVSRATLARLEGKPAPRPDVDEREQMKLELEQAA